MRRMRTALLAFAIIRDEVVQAHADWGPTNEVKLVRFVARKD
jgi:hypothetical protein